MNWKFSGYSFRGIRLLKGYLFIGATGLILATLLYTNSLVRRLEEEPKALSKIFAQFSATATLPATENPEVEIIFKEVIKKINFPVIVTDPAGFPRAWLKVGIDSDEVPSWVLDSLTVNPSFTPAKEIKEKIDLLMKTVKSLDAEHTPVKMAVLQDGDSIVVGYVHYGDSKVVKELRYMPYVQIGLIGLFILIGFLGFKTIKANEERSVWVGMAKETAHQLGTPISSLLGWVEILKNKKGGDYFEETLREMENDIKRLKSVALRFSQIGSEPVMEKGDILDVLRDTAAYFRRRLPGIRIRKSIEINEKYEEIPQIMFNKELLTWALENVIKNSIDAIENEKGNISIETRTSQKWVDVLVTDNGKGMDGAEVSKIFKTGYTTKKIGWGLGLKLARRIVEEMHNGKLQVIETAPKKGTTVMIRLPIEIK